MIINQRYGDILGDDIVIDNKQVTQQCSSDDKNKDTET